MQPIYLYVPTILNCFAMLRQGAKIAGEQTQHQALLFFFKGKVANVKNSQLAAGLNLKGFQIALWLLMVVEEVMHHMPSIPFSHRLSEWL